MQRRLFWILLGLVAIAAVVAVRLLLVPGRQDQFGQLMSVGAGYLVDEQAQSRSRIVAGPTIEGGVIIVSG